MYINYFLKGALFYLCIGLVVALSYFIKERRLEKQWRASPLRQVSNIMLFVFLWIIIVGDLVGDLFMALKKIKIKN